MNISNIDVFVHSGIKYKNSQVRIGKRCPLDSHQHNIIIFNGDIDSMVSHLCNFGRGHHEEQFREIILNLDQWFRRYCFKDISYLQLWRPFVQRSGTICAIMVEGIMKNNSVKIF